MDKDKARKKRDEAVSFTLELKDGDRIVRLLSRESGLFIITQQKIFRTQTPDQLDPNLDHPDAPWEQSEFLPLGSSDPLVARTILQTHDLAQAVFGATGEQHRLLMDVGWEVLNSLLSVRRIRQRLEGQILGIASTIERDIKAYTTGRTPKPLPAVDYYDIEFRSFVNEVRRVLSAISDLFGILTPKSFEGGHFHRAIEWASDEHGPQSPLTQMLKGDQRWIKTWIDVRVAIEHPKADRFVETLNFSLEPNRQVRLPSWRFVHPEYDMGRPQNLLDVMRICIDNILKFYEDLQVVLVGLYPPKHIQLGVEFIDDDHRDPMMPMRMKFTPLLTTSARK